MATAEAKKPTPQAPVFEKGLLAPPRTLNELTSQLTSAISAEDLRAEVTWLADPARDGRLTGTDGAKAASQMLAEYYKKIGLQPVGDSFFLPFDFNAGEKLGGDNSMVLTRSEGGSNDSKTVVTAEAPYKVEKDFRPLAFTENGSTEGEVVFAGYGLSVPEGGATAEGGANARYNSYDGLDVKDKIVLVLRYVPEAVDPPRRAQLNRYAGLRYKAMLARERGARRCSSSMVRTLPARANWYHWPAMARFLPPAFVRVRLRCGRRRVARAERKGSKGFAGRARHGESAC
jgi:hypothetical protein